MDRESTTGESLVLPVELAGQTPRKIRMTSTGWLNVFAAMLFSFLGVAAAFYIVKSVIRDVGTQDTLRQSSAESLGEVTGKRYRGKVGYVSYQFSVGGAIYTSEAFAPRKVLDGLQQNDSLPIRYAPANPHISHPAAWDDSPYPKLWGLLIPGVLVFMGLMLVRRIPLQRRIAMEGVAVRGCVTQREWNGPSKGQPYTNYSFRNASNDEVEIGSCPYDFPPKGGSYVWVLYLPTDPRRSEIYPFGIDFFRIDR
jgi:hypothetical protein